MNARVYSRVISYLASTFRQLLIPEV